MKKIFYTIILTLFQVKGHALDTQPNIHEITVDTHQYNKEIAVDNQQWNNEVNEILAIVNRHLPTPYRPYYSLNEVPTFLRQVAATYRTTSNLFFENEDDRNQQKDCLKKLDYLIKLSNNPPYFNIKFNISKELHDRKINEDKFDKVMKVDFESYLKNKQLYTYYKNVSDEFKSKYEIDQDVLDMDAASRHPGSLLYGGEVMAPILHNTIKHLEKYMNEASKLEWACENHLKTLGVTIPK